MSPSHGVSSESVFDLIFNSDNALNCRYTIDFQYEINDQFDLMVGFDSTDSIVHSTSDFSLGDQNDHTIYVWCIDPYWNPLLDRGAYKYSFDLRFDSTKPSIEQLFTFPESPIAEIPANVSLQLRADEPVVCRYDEVEQDYASMDYEFIDYPDRLYDTIKEAYEYITSSADYAFNVACENEAELVSDTYLLQFTVDPSIELNIVDHTEPYQGSTTPTIAVETNKQAGCRYSFVSYAATDGFLESDLSYMHTKTLTNINLSEFDYIVYI